MSGLILMAVCCGAGVLLSRSGKVPANAHQGLNGAILYLTFPALILAQLHRVTVTRDLALAAAVPWLLFLVGALAFFLLGRALGFSKQTVGALTLVGGLGNTSFVGLVGGLLGKHGIPLALVVDQAGTYLVLSTLGTIALSNYCAEKKDFAAVTRRILSFPPFLTLCAALLMGNIEYPEWLESSLTRLADLTGPLALLSAGMQLRLESLGENRRPLLAGLGFKLVACPLIALGLVALLGTHLASSTGHVILLESAMGPQIGAGVLATQHGLNPKLVTLMIGVGIPLCLVTVPLWSLGMRLVGI